jgi:molybdopterin synthase sulfur carrier subunit
MATIKFYAGLRKIAGKETNVTANSVRAVLDALVATYPELGETLWDGAALRPHIVITINGHTLDPEGRTDIPVGPDDLIAIFPPIAGG